MVCKIVTQSPKPIIHTDDGQSFEFDEVVVTAPLGWLQKNKQAFEPELPDRFCEALDAVGYGNLEKVRQITRTYNIKQLTD